MPTLPLVLTWGLKATPIFLLAWGVTRLLRRASAATRHFVWCLAVAASLLLPVATAWAPTVSLPLLPAGSAPVTEPAPPQADPAASLPLAPPRSVLLRDAAVATSEAREAAPAPVGSPTSAQRLTLAWGTGAGVMALLVLASLFGTALLARRGVPVPASHPLARTLAEGAAALGIRRRVRLLLAPGDAMPMTWGFVRPTILVPASAVSWPADRMRTVLVHELAHVRRADWLTQLMARVACALHWWNPLVWVAARHLREEREHACDDLVLRQGVLASAYATDLLEIARGFRTARPAALAGVAMARPSQLSSRLLAVLDAARARHPLRPALAIPLAAAILALTLPAAGLSLVRAATAPVTPPPVTAASTTEKPVEALPVTPEPDETGALAARTDDLRAPVPERQARLLCDWSREGKSRSSHTNYHDDDASVRIVVDGCTLSVEARGMVTFTRDERDVATLGPGGTFEIEERTGDRRRTVEVSRRGDGLERRWLVNRQETPWNAEASEWLAGALQVMFRRTSYQARERAERIHAARGADGLWAEIPHLHSSSALTVYYQVLLDRSRPDAAQALRIALDAGRRISSSSDLASVLGALLTRSAADDATRLAIIESAGRIASNSERAEVLVAATASRPPSRQEAGAIVEAARGIESSSERARVLTAVGARLPAREPLPDTYIQVAGGIRSGSELAEVLVGLLERDVVVRERLVAVLTIARQISSPSELARVLVAAMERGPLDDGTRGPFFLAAGQVRSGSERARVLVRVVEEGGADPASAAMVLESATGISSSSERARVLVALATAGWVSSEGLRQQYRDVASGIPSRSERERALRAIGG